MAQTKKTIRFYSKKELSALKSFIKGHTKPNDANLAEFCKQYQRSADSVRALVYKLRKQNGTTRRTKRVNSTKNDVLTVMKNEFKIPIKNWNVSQENGTFYFSVKF